MTAKTLSWTTFGLLIAGSAPFVSNPAVASVSAGLGDNGYNALTSTLPACGACNIKPTQEFQKAYAVDPNSLCPPDEPYRITMRLSSKIICTNGSYWVCEDTSSMACSQYSPRPLCPQDSCAR